MQNQRIEKLVVIAISITKVLLIIYLGFEEVFKMIKSLQKLLEAELDISRKWATKLFNFKKTTRRTESSGSLKILLYINLGQTLSYTLRLLQND